MSKLYLESETSSEMSNEANDDYNEILQKSLLITIELDDTKRLLKDKEFELNTQIKTLSNENDNLKKTVQSFTELVEYYKQQDNKKSDSVILEFQSINTELNNKVSELANKLLMTEQREYNLKREVISLNSTIGELKMEIEKNNKNVTISEGELKDLLTELEDLRKENNDISERALNMLTEKEMLLIQMKEEIDGLKSSITKKDEEIAVLKDDLHTKPLETSTFYENRRESLVRKKDSEINEVRRDYTIKLVEWNKEREHLKSVVEELDEKLKSINDDHEKEINECKNEMARSSINGNIVVKENNFDEFERYNNLINSLEQKNEETSNYYKAQIKILKDEMTELDKINTTSQQQLDFLNKELIDIKLENNKKLANLQEKQKFELTARDKDIQFFKSKIEVLEKDREVLRKDLETTKAFNEKTKEDYLELMDQLNKIKDNHEIEKSKLEDKLVHLENFGDITYNDVSMLDKSVRKPTLNNIFTMNETFDNEMDKSKISVLENEVKSLNTKLKQKDIHSTNVFRLNSEIQLLIKEKLKIKEEMTEMKGMYELQIKDLLLKLQTATEVRQCPQLSESFNPVETIELEEKVNNYKAENKFLTEQIEILKDEIKGINWIKDSVIKKQKDELEEFQLIAADAKVSLAQIVFERDSEIMKYKLRIKKLRAKNTMSMSTFSSEKEMAIPVNKTSFFKKMFK
jgi:hypothetical protein